MLQSSTSSNLDAVPALPLQRGLCFFKNLYRAKKSPYVNMIQKHRCLLWTKAHSKWTEKKCGQINVLHVFGWWEEVPGQNPHMHGQIMQTPHRKAPTGI